MYTLRTVDVLRYVSPALETKTLKTCDLAPEYEWRILRHETPDLGYGIGHVYSIADLPKYIARCSRQVGEVTHPVLFDGRPCACAARDSAGICAKCHKSIPKCWPKRRHLHDPLGTCETCTIAHALTR